MSGKGRKCAERVKRRPKGARKSPEAGKKDIRLREIQQKQKEKMVRGCSQEVPRLEKRRKRLRVPQYASRCDWNKFACKAGWTHPEEDKGCENANRKNN